MHCGILLLASCSEWPIYLQVHVLARVRLGPVSIYIPVKVEDLQLSANARITIRPLVDTLPCLGAISISLTESPFVDLTLKAINNMDLLSVPFVHDAVLQAIKMVAEQVHSLHMISVACLCDFCRNLQTSTGLFKVPLNSLPLLWALFCIITGTSLHHHWCRVLCSKRIEVQYERCLLFLVSAFVDAEKGDGKEGQTSGIPHTEV
jgi:hypothetical protein